MNEWGLEHTTSDYPLYDQVKWAIIQKHISMCSEQVNRLLSQYSGSFCSYSLPFFNLFMLLS